MTLPNENKGCHWTVIHPATWSYSKRLDKKKLSVGRRFCPYCNHHKFIKNMSGTKCSRCKRYFVNDGRWRE